MIGYSGNPRFIDLHDSRRTGTAGAATPAGEADARIEEVSTLIQRIHDVDGSSTLKDWCQGTRYRPIPRPDNG